MFVKNIMGSNSWLAPLLKSGSTLPEAEESLFLHKKREELGTEETVFVKDIVDDDSTLELVSDTDELETFLELHEVEQTVFPPVFVMDITGVAEIGIPGTGIEDAATDTVFLSSHKGEEE